MALSILVRMPESYGDVTLSARTFFGSVIAGETLPPELGACSRIDSVIQYQLVMQSVLAGDIFGINSQREACR
jgi:hypothetical protein